jgi:hypothetical protein
MKKVKGMPITGTNTAMRPTPNVLSDAADTSRDGQKLIKAAPQPFQNKMGTPNLPAPGAASGGVSTLEPKIQSGLKHSNPGVRALPPGGPVGQRKPVNQSGQVNGRMGTSFPRKVGQNGGGFPSKRNARFYGE